MAAIPVGAAGHIAIVDDADHEMLARYRWFAQPKRATVYAHRNIVRDGFPTTRFMHHDVLGSLPPGMWVDHINGDGLDNRRVNLRFASPTENARNKRVRKDSGTGIKGVRRRPSGRWTARICVNGCQIWLGTFNSPEDAAAAYLAAAREHFGKFARGA